MAYIVLAATSLLATALLVYQRRDATLLAAFFVAGALLITGDFVAHGLFELYLYRPHLVAGDIPDSSLGLLLAELGFGASLAVLAEGYLPGWRGVVLNTAVVTVTEYILIRTGLFEHQGWNLWYTLVGFPLYLGAVHFFRRAAISQGLREGWTRAVVRVSIGIWWWNLVGVILAWLKALVVIQVQLMPTFGTNQALGLGLTNGIFAVSAFYWVLAGGPENRLQRLLTAVLGLAALDYVWAALGVWAFREPWNIFWNSSTTAAEFYAACLTDDWISRWAGVAPGPQEKRPAPV